MQRKVDTTGAGGGGPTPDNRRRSLSVVIPVLDEARGVGTLVARVSAVLEGLGRPWEIVFVDDGSTDATLAALEALNARDARIKAVSLSRNFGKEIAVAAGLRHATGDGVVIMDGDLQHPPEVVAEFVRRWDEGYAIVYGVRRSRVTDTALHRAAARVFYRVFERMSGTELPQGAGDFRLLDRRAVDAFNALGERARFNKGLYAWIGFRSVGVTFDVAPRADGASRWRPGRLFKFALDGLASFTTLPLRVWSYVGLGVSALAFAYVLVFLVKTLIFGIDQPGFPTLVISVLFLGGVQLISLGVIGEYLGRVYEEVKGRPLYVVGRRIGLADDAGPAPPSGAETCRTTVTG